MWAQHGSHFSRRFYFKSFFSAVAASWTLKTAWPPSPAWTMVKKPFKMQRAFGGQVIVLQRAGNFVSGIRKAGLAAIRRGLQRVALRQLDGDFVSFGKGIGKCDWIPAPIMCKHPLLQSGKEEGWGHQSLAGRRCEVRDLGRKACRQGLIG